MRKGMSVQQRSHMIYCARTILSTRKNPIMREEKIVSTSLAVIADIHGNRWALEAVLQDIDRRGIQQVVNLGDHLTGPLDPAGTADLLIARTMVNVCGNDDRELFLPQEKRSLSQNYTCTQLTPAHSAWLHSLPDTTIVADELFVCHGDLFDAPYLLEEVTPSGVFLRSTSAIATSVAEIAQPVILIGHSHIPRPVSLPHAKLTLNPGTIG